MKRICLIQMKLKALVKFMTDTQASNQATVCDSRDDATMIMCFIVVSVKNYTVLFIYFKDDFVEC